MPPQNRLPFETEIAEMEANLARLEEGSNGALANSESISALRRQIVDLKREVYSKLSAWDTVLVSRHGERPQLLDYIEMIFEDFCELHGDRAWGDDRALRVGFARLGDFRVMLLG